MCPACARMHGRIGDAVLPLMYLAEKTGNQKYLLGAKRLMAVSYTHRLQKSTILSASSGPMEVFR